MCNITSTNGKIDNLINYNLITDDGKLRRRINAAYNKTKLRELIENKAVQANIIGRFPIEQLQDADNFL
jgi:hypothetical protein